MHNQTTQITINPTYLREIEPKESIIRPAAPPEQSTSLPEQPRHPTGSRPGCPNPKPDQKAPLGGSQQPEQYIN
ncbi:unnamed protein product [Cuscuta campestris]|uniref:Uncharacterized protein n=1 Tax=Cuscuta campestris TaxID=132261 RepID=A0A484MGB7_9ASTE|nr:unnamed protein product [Cuscuta campestris]